MKKYLTFAGILLAKLVISWIAWIILFLLVWEMGLGSSPDVAKPYWAGILGHAYWYMLACILLTDLLIVRRLQPLKPVWVYWVALFGNALSITLSIGLWTWFHPGLAYYFFLELHYISECLPNHHVIQLCDAYLERLGLK